MELFSIRIQRTFQLVSTIYGHSHTNIDARIGNTQCLSNQLGYVFSNEHQDFSHGKYLTI